MEKLFVPFELAKQLKEKGFNEPCLALFNNSNTPIISGNTPVYNSKTEDESIICSPLYQQVVDWFREKHKIELSTTSWKKESAIGGIVWYYSVNDIGKPCKFNCIDHETIYEALTGAINEAFKIIK